jgi:hypothetical protein
MNPRILIKRLCTGPWFPRRREPAIWGWWEGNNQGDLWIQEIMRRHFPSSRFIDTTVSDFSPYAMVICGGGGLFIRSVHPAWRNPVPVPYGMLGLGAEFPHCDDEARHLQQKAAFFYVRDQYSVDCMRLPSDCLSGDLTFSSPLRPVKSVPEKRLLFVWRNPEELLNFPDFREYIGDCTSASQWERILANGFEDIVRDDFSARTCTIGELTERVGFVVSGRYHGIVAAIQRGIPCIGIDLCPKIRAVMRDCGIEEYCLKMRQVDQLAERIDRARSDAMSIRDRQLNFAATLAKQTQMHVRHVQGIVKSIAG